MTTLSRRQTLARGGKAIAAAAVLPFVPSIALGASNDAALIRMEKEVFRLIDEINAGLHSPDGDVSDEVWDRLCDLASQDPKPGNLPPQSPRDTMSAG